MAKKEKSRFLLVLRKSPPSMDVRLMDFSCEIEACDEDDAFRIAFLQLEKLGTPKDITCQIFLLGEKSDIALGYVSWYPEAAPKKFGFSR